MLFISCIYTYIHNVYSFIKALTIYHEVNEILNRIHRKFPRSSVILTSRWTHRNVTLCSLWRMSMSRDSAEGIRSTLPFSFLRLLPHMHTELTNSFLLLTRFLFHLSLFLFFSPTSIRPCLSLGDAVVTKVMTLDGDERLNSLDHRNHCCWFSVELILPWMHPKHRHHATGHIGNCVP